jgi:hypothetical protein
MLEVFWEKKNLTGMQRILHKNTQLPRLDKYINKIRNPSEEMKLFIFPP